MKGFILFGNKGILALGQVQLFRPGHLVSEGHTDLSRAGNFHSIQTQQGCSILGLCLHGSFCSEGLLSFDLQDPLALQSSSRFLQVRLPYLYLPQPPESQLSDSRGWSPFLLTL